jgi:hypothetical protein
MPQKVVQTHSARKSQALAIAVDSFKFCQAGDDVGLQINRTISCRTDEARRRCANPLDGL